VNERSHRFILPDVSKKLHIEFVGEKLAWER
jgi:hypothetical protein